MKIESVATTTNLGDNPTELFDGGNPFEVSGGDNGSNGNSNPGNPGEGGGGEPPALTPEQEAIITQFGGNGFNENGDLIDESGNVVKTKAELNEADNNKPVLDADGNLVDKDGNILKTKEELALEKEEEEETAVFNNIVKSIGYNIIGADGKPKNYEPSINGITEYMKDVVSIVKDTTLKEIKSNDRVARYIDFVNNGGNDEDFFIKKPDAAKIDIDKATDDECFNLIVAYHIERGEDEETAKKLATYSKQAGNLVDDSKAAQTKLDAIRLNRQQKAILAAQLQREKDQEDERKYWDGIKKLVVDTGKINTKVGEKEYNIDIPLADRKSFFDYIGKVDEKGFTPVDYDVNKETIEQKLLFDYLFRFKKLNVADVIDTMVKSEKVRKLTALATSRNNLPGDNKQSPARNSLGKMDLPDDPNSLF